MTPSAVRNHSFGVGHAMDIPRPDLLRRRRRRRWLAVALTLVGVSAVTVALSRLEPAAPSVDRSSVVIDTVKRGLLLIQVRGTGTLVPEQIQDVQAETDGRVERILVQPGAEVAPDDILLELSNPELKQSAFDAEWQHKAAEAQLNRLRVQLESDRLSQESALATLRADEVQARLEALADEVLAKDGLVPAITLKRSMSKAADLASRCEIDQRRLDFARESADAQLAVQQAEVEKFRAQRDLRQRQVANLQVRAGIAGVLRQTGESEPLEVGQRVGPNATLAKVIDPNHLKAEIRVPETQARDVQRGQHVIIDTRTSGRVPGRVARIDPAVENGTVLVEVQITGPLPRGARPDLSVEGIIELQRLEDVLHVGKPVQAQNDATVGLFRVAANGEAHRVPVHLGKSSVIDIEVVEGLAVGDQVIVSDTSTWDAHDRLRVR